MANDKWGNIVLMHKNKDVLDTIEKCLSSDQREDNELISDWQTRHGGIYEPIHS